MHYSRGLGVFFQIIYYGFNFRPKKGGDPDSIILVGMSLSDAWWEKPAKHGGLSLRGTLERGGPQEYLRKFFCVFFCSQRCFVEVPHPKQRIFL